MPAFVGLLPLSSVAQVLASSRSGTHTDRRTVGDHTLRIRAPAFLRTCGNSTPAIRDEMTKQSSRKNAVSQLSCLTLNVLSAVCLFMMRTTISLNYAKLIPLNMSTVKAMAAKFDSHRDD